MMERLMHPPHVIGSKFGSHRLDALAFQRQQQSLAVRFQRLTSVRVPCGFRQAIKICRKAFLLWAWRRGFAHETILYQNVLF
jgi:hypothetical protein